MLKCSCKKNCIPTSYVCFLICLTVQILIGFAILGLCEYVKNLFSIFLQDIQQNDLDIRLFLIEMFAIHLILFYACGYPLATRTIHDSYTRHLELLLKFWSAIILMISIEGALTTWMFIASFQFMEVTVKSSLYTGIDYYHQDTTWRQLWDTLQFEQQCCGVIDYKDWEAMTWKEYQLNDNDTA